MKVFPADLLQKITENSIVTIDTLGNQAAHIMIGLFSKLDHVTTESDCNHPQN